MSLNMYAEIVIETQDGYAFFLYEFVVALVFCDTIYTSKLPVPTE